MEKIGKKHIYIIVIGLACLLIGGGVGYFFGYNYEKGILDTKLNVIRPIRENDPAYKFIDPLLAYIIPSSIQDERFTSLRNKVSKFIDLQKQNGLSDASVYISDLNRGRWIGVNENVQYNPASMLKVVIMVAYFKDSEKNPAILGKNLLYAQDLNNLLKKDQFNSQSSLQISRWYSVDYLINKMIVDSDNGAEFTLLHNINQSSLESIYTALKIQSPEKVDGNFIISPRTYSLFFRIIYSATYLDKDLSEKALNILSKTTFEDGIVAGLPEGMTVSHKFGEYVNVENNQIGSIELHDCGIVYYPSYPYLLCVMTKGNNLDVLKNTIKEISSMVYQNYSK